MERSLHGFYSGSHAQSRMRTASIIHGWSIEPGALATRCTVTVPQTLMSLGAIIKTASA
jgi:hypothetical protein